MGSALATVTNASDTAVTAVFPPSATAGPVIVRLIDEDGQSDTSVFTYFTQAGAPPVIQSLAPAIANAGDELDVNGSGFDSDARVLVGGQLVAVQRASSSISLTVPNLDSVVGQSAGLVAVQIENDDGQTASATFTYVPAGGSADSGPIIDAIQPDNGPLSGGEQVTIIGDNFSFNDTVLFSGQPIDFQLDKGGNLFFFPPQTFAPGTITVRIIDGQGRSASTLYRYVDGSQQSGGPPAIGLVTPGSLHALVPGDIIDLVGSNLDTFSLATMEDTQGTPQGSVNVLTISGGDVKLLITSALQPSDQTGHDILFRLAFPDGSSVVSQAVPVIEPRISTALENNGRLVLLGEGYNPSKLVNVVLRDISGLANIDLGFDNAGASESVITIGELPAGVPGDTLQLVGEYLDTVNSGVVDVVFAGGPVVTEAAFGLAPDFVTTPVLPANESLAGRHVRLSIETDGQGAFFGNPTTAQLFDPGSGNVFADGVWSFVGQGELGPAVLIDWNASAPVPEGAYLVRLATDLSPEVASGGIEIGVQDREVEELVPPVSEQGGAFGGLGGMFDGDTIVAENIATGVPVGVGTSNAVGCVPAESGCTFTGSFSAGVPLPPGDYRICAVGPAAAPACPSSPAVLHVQAPGQNQALTYSTNNCQVSGDMEDG
ncbi:MAG TPA: IPT/TIG domain-containing protein, partial [Myxococcota bacterium]